MKVMIFGATSASQHVSSYETFKEIKMRKGDAKTTNPGTRGDIARELACDTFLSKPDPADGKFFDALLMLDLDQKFPIDTLEKLRKHDLDMVTGHYMKRATRPMQSIWQYSPDGTWPYIPVLNIPRDGLHKIATTGHGCVLIKRKVLEDVRDYLPEGDNPFAIGPMPEMAGGEWNSFGSDYRFFYIAGRLGYELWGDASIDTPHANTVWLTVGQYYREKHMTSDLQLRYFQMLAEKIERIHGMNRNALEARKMALQMEIAKSTESINQQMTLNNTLKAKLAEVEHWISEEGAEPEKRTIEKLNVPVFRSLEEAKGAVKNRETAFDGENPELARQIRRETNSQRSINNVKQFDGKSPHRFDENGQMITTSTKEGVVAKVS